MEKWVSWLQPFVGHWHSSLLSHPSWLRFSRFQLKLLFPRCRLLLVVLQLNTHSTRQNLISHKSVQAISLSIFYQIQLCKLKKEFIRMNQPTWRRGKGKFWKWEERLGIIASFVQTRHRPETEVASFSRTPSQKSICFPITVVWPPNPRCPTDVRARCSPFPAAATRQNCRLDSDALQCGSSQTTVDYWV